MIFFLLKDALYCQPEIRDLIAIITVVPNLGSLISSSGQLAVSVSLKHDHKAVGMGR